MVTKSSREMQKDREKIRPPFGGLKFCQGTHYLPLTHGHQIFQRNAERQRKNKTAVWRSKILSRYALSTTYRLWVICYVSGR